MSEISLKLTFSQKFFNSVRTIFFYVKIIQNSASWCFFLPRISNQTSYLTISVIFLILYFKYLYQNCFLQQHLEQHMSKKHKPAAPLQHAVAWKHVERVWNHQDNVVMFLQCFGQVTGILIGNGERIFFSLWLYFPFHLSQIAIFQTMAKLIF